MAAEQVITTARQIFSTFSVGDNVINMLKEFIQESHTLIQLAGISSEKEPHSTVVALVITPMQTAFWAHVGDSRLYHFTGPNFFERTRDHSYVEKLVESGQITQEEAKKHKLSNILVNVLGAKSMPPYITVGCCQKLTSNDSFLLCSDGIWPQFTDEELASTLFSLSPRIASETLITKARERAHGRSDNCTLAIIKLTDTVIPEQGYAIEKMSRAI
jgi:serine/threonine protein phosphatase PrpC